MDRMLDLLRAKAPNLRPNVIPRPFKHAVSSNLFTLCRTAEQRAAVKAFLDGQGQEDGEIEGEGLLRDAGDGQRPEGRDHVVLKTDIDMGTQTFRITGAKLSGEIDATLHDLERLMDLQLNASRAELEPYVSRFAAANDLDPGVAATLALQDVCGLAYAFQVSTSHMPGWTGYVGPSLQLPIPAAANMTELLQQIFEPSPRPIPEPPVGKTRRGGRGSGKRPKSKSKDSKKKRRAQGN